MHGYNLSASIIELNAGESSDLNIGPNTLAVQCYDGLNLLDISKEEGYIADNNCRIIVISQVPVIASLDPMHPKAGEEMISVAFEPFEMNFPEEMGSGINFFFSDELGFGVSGNLWNPYLAREFISRKGYDLMPFLSCLFVDAGDITPKIRLDYRDVMVSLQEENFFKPIYEWFEKRKMIYGCDHGGRGRDVLEFGDYFRTQRYNQGPGCDQPFLTSDVVKNKVASSIAHLYERPRTWLEGFYGSGWGTTGEDVADAIFRNFAQGQNLLSLHALYYSTKGGYWEWAPPCNHFRMPYWECMDDLLACSERLSWLLTQGSHVCDIAIVYPVAAMEANEKDGLKAVELAFSLGEYLYGNRIDFDYIDFESIVRAKIDDDELCVAKERYKVIILPGMQAVRFSMVEKLVKFQNAGGTVLSYYQLPKESDRVGRNDSKLADICDLLSNGLIKTKGDLLNKIRDVVPPRFIYHGEEKVFFLTRAIEESTIYFLYGAKGGTRCEFYANGNPLLLNPWTGESYRLQYKNQKHNHIELELPFDANPYLITFVQDDTEDVAWNLLDSQPLVDSMNIDRKLSLKQIIKTDEICNVLPREWNCELLPTMDNRWGDFRLPSSNEKIGSEIRRARFFAQGMDMFLTMGYGSYWRIMAVDREKDDELLGAQWNDGIPESVILEGKRFFSSPYIYSLRYGIEDDPGHQGYHGLKGKVSNDFLVFGERMEKMTEYTYEDENKNYYLHSYIYSDRDYAWIITGALKPDDIWINGKRVEIRAEKIKLEIGYNLVLLRYTKCGRTHFLLSADKDPTSHSIHYPLSMDWYENPSILSGVMTKELQEVAMQFQTPPGMREMFFYSFASPVITCNGQVVQATETGAELFSAKEYMMQYTADEPVDVSIKLEAFGHLRSADIIPEPIRFSCGIGKITLGDWSKIEGLHSYSGCVKITQHIDLLGEINRNTALVIENIRGACKVEVNGISCGKRIAPPWKFSVGENLKKGTNTISIYVYNTLANHYTTIPTRYRGDVTYGIMGDVFLISQ